MTPFAEASAVVADADGWAAEIPADWAQGRTAFGGLSAAITVRAVQSLPAVRGLPVRSVDVAFIGPVPPGPVTVHAQVLRQGKYLTHAAAELRSVAGDLLTRTHVVLGRLRESGVRVAPRDPHPVPMADCLEVPHVPGLTPDFMQGFDFRFASGLPYSGSQEARIDGYCRHRSPAAGVPALVALVDAWPGTVLPVLTEPAPASTVRWTVQLPDDEPIAGEEWFWYESRTAVADGGYSTIVAHLWCGSRLVAWTEQLLAVFDRR